MEGGYLAKISSEKENEEILEVIERLGSYVQGFHFHIGLNDIKKDGDYRWVSDNTSKEYDNFNTGSF